MPNCHRVAGLEGGVEGGVVWWEVLVFGVSMGVMFGGQKGGGGSVMTISPDTPGNGLHAFTRIEFSLQLTVK